MARGLLWARSNPTILISDDEPQMVSALAREARSHGLFFISDTESERTVDLAREQHPDVIILDLHGQLCFELGAHDFQTKPLDPTFMIRIARLAKQHVDEVQ